jgi:GT2 family glycosyltransferase
MNWASRLSVLKNVGFFDESILRGEDVDLSYRLFQAGYKFFYKPEALVFHSNRRTLRGLFREGYLHGMGSVEIQKKHSSFLKKFGHRRFYLKSYVQILWSFVDFMRGINPNKSLCDFVFNAGKKSGRIVGSAKFLHLAL